jgi:hypothetical protein
MRAPSSSSRGTVHATRSARLSPEGEPVVSPTAFPMGIPTPARTAASKRVGSSSALAGAASHGRSRRARARPFLIG